MTHNLNKHISVDPMVMRGKPVISGTRITVELVLQMLAQGESTDWILQNYPNLTKENVLACIAYASRFLHTEEVYA